MVNRTNNNKFTITRNNVTHDLIDLKTLIKDTFTNSVDRDNALKKLKTNENNITKIETTNTHDQENIANAHNLLIISFKQSKKYQSKELETKFE